MQVMNQDENYEEDYGFENETGEYDEADEDTEAEVTHIYGIPKNIFFIGVIVLVVIVLGIILFSNRGKDDEEQETVNIATETIVDNQPTQSSEDIAVASGVYDAAGNKLGIAYVPSVGGSILSESDEFLYDISDVGDTEVFTENGVSIGFINTGTTTESDITTDNASVEALRRAGYTGDEIDIALNNNMNNDELLATSEELQNEVAKEALIRMSDTASPEFQERTNYSVYCMPLNQFDTYDPTIPGSINGEYSYIVNADFEKVPTYGLQLFIKCKIADGTYIFYNITPARWEELPDTGNIVLRINYRLYGTTAINMWVTSIEEVNVQSLTVNPEDSAVSLQEIVNSNLPQQQEVVE